MFTPSPAGISGGMSMARASEGKRKMEKGKMRCESRRMRALYRIITVGIMVRMRCWVMAFVLGLTGMASAEYKDFSSIYVPREGRVESKSIPAAPGPHLFIDDELIESSHNL